MWLALAVAGFTLSDASLYLVVVESVEAGRRASATALLQVAQATGMIGGLSLLASQGLGRFDERAEQIFSEQSVAADSADYRAAAHETFDETLAGAAIVMAAGAAAALALRHPRPRAPWLARSVGLARRRVAAARMAASVAYALSLSTAPAGA